VSAFNTRSTQYGKTGELLKEPRPPPAERHRDDPGPPIWGAMRMGKMALPSALEAQIIVAILFDRRGWGALGEGLARRL